jgi:uncharacterized protein YecE (DUF72 family)
MDSPAASPSAARPRLLAGASGFSYKAWCGSFYPERLAADAMLAWYAERLPTVEINNSFYRMPKREMLEHWAETTPAGFRFAVKASRRITHDGRLKAEQVAEPLAYLYRNLESLGDRRGPVLFQLPPNLKRDLPRLTDFLALLPPDHRAVFGFREPSWFDDAVHDALKNAGAARGRRRAPRCAGPRAPPTRRRRWCAPPTGATCACGWSSTARPTLRAGRRTSPPPAGARPSPTSCTSPRRPATRWR